MLFSSVATVSTLPPWVVGVEAHLKVVYLTTVF